MSVFSVFATPNYNFDTFNNSSVVNTDDYIASLERDMHSAKSVVNSYNWVERNILDNTGYNSARADYVNASNLYHTALNEQKNREYQTAMSNSAYQRAVEDLKKAGLNPYLAYTQGGANVPSSSVSARSSNVGIAGYTFGQVLGNLVSSAFVLSKMLK